MTNSQDFDIAIIGAGIAGVAFAIACENAKLKYTLYESGPSIWQHGSGIGVAPNAIRALEAIDTRLPSRLANVGAQHAGITSDFLYKHGQDSQRWKAFDVIGKVGTEGAKTVARSDFMNEMVPLVPAEKIKFGKHLASITEGERVQLKFRDGTSAEHDIVVGSDGVHSKTRHWILDGDADATPRFTGKIVHRGVVPASTVKEIFGDHHHDGVSVFLGYHGHIVMMPIQQGEKYSLTGVASRKTWDHHEWVIPSTAQELRDDYTAWDDRLVKVLEQAGNTDIWALFDVPFAPNFTKGQVTVLGDAAHSSTPFQGSGTSMALEDAYILAALLARAGSTTQAKAALRAYDTVRRPRTQKQVQTALETGWMMDLEHPKVGDDIEMYRSIMNSRTEWLWHWDLKAGIQKASDIMDGRR